MKIEKKLNQSRINLIVIVLLIVGLFIVINADILKTPAVRYSGNQTSGTLNSPNVIKEIEGLKNTVAANPGNLDAVLKLAHKLSDNGYHNEAIKHYDSYLNKYPENADVIVDKGVCYFEMKDYDRAVEIMEGAVKVNPEHQIAYFNLGIVNFSAGNKDKAREWWNTLINKFPGSEFSKKAKNLINSNL